LLSEKNLGGVKLEKKPFKKKLSSALASTLLLGTVLSPMNVLAENPAKTIVKLRLMETTDIHTNIVNYDYYADKTTDTFGLAKTATLIKQKRAEVKNSLLFDNGDLIQGNPLADYKAKVDVLEDGEVHPVYKAMNLLDYDAGNIGNHEFNYGLEFLEKSLKGSEFPYVNANVYIDDKDNDPSNDKNYFTPYLILNKEVVDENGQKHTLKVGVIGFVPPQITEWDKKNLEGKVIAKDIVETAKHFIPKMKAEGADIIVAIPHSGFNKVTPQGNDENAVYYLSKVEGIDAILFGHAHILFPGDKSFQGVEGVDPVKGTINGVAAVEPGKWGDHLGLIDLTIEKVDGKWKVVDSQSAVVPIYDSKEKKPLVDADHEILDAVKEDHEATLNYIRGPIGSELTAPIHSFFAQVQDDPSIQIVNNAQIAYIEKQIQGTEYEGIPILSAAAPFKFGRNGASDYSNIPAGALAVKDLGSIYYYDNTVSAVLLNGEQVKEWLEMSAIAFNQIDPNKTEEQSLLNPEVRGYNFDVIDGVTYQIDVTQPPKYNTEGKIINPDANRIKDLKFQGKPVTKDQKFIVVTNNYRAGGGGNFPFVKENVIISSPDENRQAVLSYIMDNKKLNPSSDNNWSIAPIKGNVNVTFNSSPDAKAFAEETKNIKFISTLEDGYAKYRIDLSADVASEKTEEKANQSETQNPATEKPEPQMPATKKPETQKPANQKPVSQKEIVYVVKSGDVLWKIAKKYGLDWKYLAQYNNLINPHLILVGQKLVIPVK
jgi:2',3'-cyclic-nucleotide 2'-phosphodiesterase/3'-nucleotidase